MQLMAERGLEHEITPGFGWIDGEIADDGGARRCGCRRWAGTRWTSTPGAHPLLDGLVPGDHAYFVHSYALRGGDPEECLATTDYGGPVVAMVAAGNRAGTQFHVEKSQEVGIRILMQFPALDAMRRCPTNVIRPMAKPRSSASASSSDDDLHALCEATDAAIIEGGGFGWVNPPGRQALERYFRGVLLVPERELFVAPATRAASSARRSWCARRATTRRRPSRRTLMHAFIAPYARGHGLARMLTMRVEEGARALGYHVLNLDVRETQDAAIRLYESLGYVRWGVHPFYARVGGKTVRGFFYYKLLKPKAA